VVKASTPFSKRSTENKGCNFSFKGTAGTNLIKLFGANLGANLGA